jgi:predicted Zn-dependent protease
MTRRLSRYEADNVPILRTVPVVFAVIGLTACSQGVDVDRAVDPLNVIDQTNLSDVMLNAASPDEAVAYFQRTLAEQPDRIDMKRGLAASLVRAGRAAEALPLWEQIVQTRARPTRTA